MSKFIALLCLWTCICQQASGLHILGGEIGYRFISADGENQVYRVTATFFIDCEAGSKGLIGATPHIRIYKGDYLFLDKWLFYNSSESNIEITPVCPDERGNTLCSSIDNTFPGVKRFTFSHDFTLKGLSDNWRFEFEGALNNGAPLTSSGRSFLFNNVAINVPFPPLPYPPDFEAGRAHIHLEATLNNTKGPNSSPAFTSQPVPFFCAHKTSSYNLGAADTENDELRFRLIPGKITATTNVAYIPPFTAEAPLPTAPGDFSFSSTTSQINFVPNQAKGCLVCYQVEEMRDGIVVGTSMREMAFVILDNCNNDVPASPVSEVKNAGIFASDPHNLVLTVCEGQPDSISFDIIPTDVNGDNTTVTYNNLPQGASITVSNNGTGNTRAHFSWSAIDAPPGNHYFYITYTDDGCPIVASKTVLYTINVIPHPFAFKGGSEPSCASASNGKAWVTPENTTMPYNYRWLDSEGNVLHTTNNSSTGDMLSGIPPGTYKVYARDAQGCGKNVTITVDEVSLPEVHLPSDTTLCNDVRLAIGVAPQRYENYLWNTGDTTCCLTIQQSGIYTLQATNSCGTAEARMQANYLKCNYCFFVPNAFSPNGDGRNDQFSVLETCLIDKYQLQIFNRWGRLLFTALSTTDSWDGTYNGQPVESGVYYYRINARLANGNKEAIKQSGDITLIR